MTQWKQNISRAYVLRTLMGLKQKRTMEGWALLIGVGFLGLQGLLFFYSPWMAWLAGFPISGLLWWFYSRCEQLQQLATQGEPARAEAVKASEAEWKRFVARHAEVLPRVVGQLNDIAGQVERGVAQACESFTDIAAQAKEAPSVRNGKIVKDISQAVMALQFQDIVNQRIEHVVSALGKLGKALEGRAKGAEVDGEGYGGKENGSWPEHLKETGLDLREPKFISEAVKREAKEKKSPEGGVELF